MCMVIRNKLCSVALIVKRHVSSIDIIILKQFDVQISPDNLSTNINVNFTGPEKQKHEGKDYEYV